MSLRIWLFILIFIAVPASHAGLILESRLGLAEPGSFGDNDSIPNSWTLTSSFALFAGLRFGRWNIGVLGEYASTSQNVPAENVNGQDISGSSLTAGGGIQYVGKSWGLGIDARKRTNYSFTNKTTSGQKLSYEGSGFSVQIYRQIYGNFGLMADYSFDSYYKTTDSDLYPSVNSSRYGIGIVWFSFWDDQSKGSPSGSASDSFFIPYY